MPSVAIRLLSPALGLALLLGVSACAVEDPDTVRQRASELSVLDDEELGGILTDGTGAVLYAFEPDGAATVSCTFTCATNWPPLAAVEGSAPAAGEGVDATLLGTLPNPSGGEIVTYGGWPLYRYDADREPGEHRGQDRYLNGGDWYVMTPEGEPLVP